MVLALGACSDDANGPTDEATVSVSDNTFGPASLDVSTGTTVTWEWEGAAAHNVTWVSGSPAPSATQTTGTYERTFAAAGAFEYYCTIHGTPTTGMRGSVTVQ
jgi:plastocyanin